MPTDGGAARVEDEEESVALDPPLGIRDAAPLPVDTDAAALVVWLPPLPPLEGVLLVVESWVAPVAVALSFDLSRTREVKVVGPTSVTELYLLNSVSMKTSRVVGVGRATDMVHEPAIRLSASGVIVVFARLWEKTSDGRAKKIKNGRNIILFRQN